MKRIYFILLSLALLVSACEKQPEPVTPGNNNNNQEQQGGQGNQGGQGGQGGQEPETNWTYYYVNNFAYDMMDSYYLWKKEIKAGLSSWKTDDNPIDKVQLIRYKDYEGHDIDKWTQVTDDFESFVGDVSGVTTTYGYDFFSFEQDKSQTSRALATVRYVYPDSPASEAGLKRGDVIVSVNNKDIPIIFTGSEGYLDVDFIYDEMIYSSSCTLELSTGEKVSMTAREMVENPVILYKVFDNGEKKIGYLHYTSFTLESCPRLIEACKYFKAQGIKELILDLRYNGGGYVFAEEILISMLAPQAAVAAGELFEKEIYNSDLTLAWGGSGESHFKTLHSLYTNDDDPSNDLIYDTSDANIGLEKIYAIVTEDSASASEAILCCLKPFMPVELIGKQTHGKYCAGYIIGSDDYFKNIKDYYTENPTAEDVKEALAFANGGLQYAKNWGIYVMYARYADRNGETLCMPDGMAVDTKSMDSPKDGYQLGDPLETMLRATLRRANFKLADASGNTQHAPERIVTPDLIKFRRQEKPGMIRIPTSLPECPRGLWQPQTSNGLYIRAE
ncbi:MAG: PDZ domain-containing protein [Bacteroidales bacterium]|nr:PDZ domain-containing protein [Bacteroidales bacterium]